ncbi:MAG: transcriptional regulator NrdR [Chloroflexota bacterium]|nr:transcriptional regulator NrdR [Chloroflexota bacterium]
MKCIYCDSFKTRVIDTRHDPRGNVRRRRECRDCRRRFSTIERPLLTAPQVIKRDNRREKFSREKIVAGLQIACARRPIPPEELENIVERVEYKIQRLGAPEVESQVIGELVVEELQKVDRVAYLRYAIVYRELDNLEDISEELNRLRLHPLNRK